MNDAVEDGVCERGYPDQIVPAVDGNLAGDDERALVVTILDDLQQIARLVGRERLRTVIAADTPATRLCRHVCPSYRPANALRLFDRRTAPVVGSDSDPANRP